MAKKPKDKTKAVKPARKADSKSGRKSGKAPKKTASVKIKVKSAPPPKKGACFDVFCSECGMGFALYPDAEGEHLECPVCGHLGSRPDAGTVQQMGTYRGTERKWAFTSGLLAFLSIVLFLVWFATKTIQLGWGEPPEPGLLESAGLPFAAVLLIIFSGVVGAMYEKSRWHFYF